MAGFDDEDELRDERSRPATEPEDEGEDAGSDDLFHLTRDIAKLLAYLRNA